MDFQVCSLLLHWHAWLVLVHVTFEHSAQIITEHVAPGRLRNLHAVEDVLHHISQTQLLYRRVTIFSSNNRSTRQ
jgi:hypothetical protein